MPSPRPHPKLKHRDVLSRMGAFRVCMVRLEPCRGALERSKRVFRLLQRKAWCAIVELERDLGCPPNKFAWEEPYSTALQNLQWRRGKIKLLFSWAFKQNKILNQAIIACFNQKGLSMSETCYPPFCSFFFYFVSSYFNLRFNNQH